MSFDEEKLRLMWEKTIVEGSLNDKDPSLTYGQHKPAPDVDLSPAQFPTLLVNSLTESAPATKPGAEFAPTLPMSQDATIIAPHSDDPTVIAPDPMADTIVAPDPLADTIVASASDADTLPDSSSQKTNATTETTKPTNFQNYHLQKEIGRGGMGVVYAAKQGGLDRLVAVKKNLDNQIEARSRFISEAIVTGQLDHPNIVPVYDMGFSTEGEVLLSMKLVGGTPWSEWLTANFTEEKRLPEEKLLEAFEILIKVCDAISFSHEKMIVHNDLKPENIMVGKHGEVFVMDWGLAVDVSHRDEATLTQSQRQTLHKSTMRSPCGTPAYMAPELANGDGEQICAQTDVYLLGAILYELVTGRRRHRGKTLLIVLRSALLSEAPDFTDHDDVETELQEICRKAMMLNPKDRYASAKEFQIAIKKHLQHRESLKIAGVADKTLEDCEKDRQQLTCEESKTLDESERNRLYGQYADVVAGYKQALILWKDNQEAKSGSLSASLAYARTALSQNDLGLAEAQLASLPPGLNSTLDLSREINAAKQELINKENQQKQVRWALAGTVVTIFIGLAIGLFFINKEKSRATENAAIARQNADRAEANAKDAKRQAIVAKQKSEEALRQKKEANRQKDEAQKQKQEAEQAREIAQSERLIANKLKAAAIDAKTRAEIEAARAQTLKNEADYQTALARYELALGTVREGDGFALASRWKQARNSYFKAKTMFENNSQPILAADLGLWSCHRVQSPVILESQNSRNAITAMTSHPTKNLIYTGHGTGVIKTWDLHTGRVLSTWYGHDKDVRSMVISPNGRYLLSGSGAKQRNVRLWAIHEKRPYSISISGHNSPVNSVAFNKKGTHFFTVGDDAKLRYWSLASRQIVTTTDIYNSRSGGGFGRKGVLCVDIAPGSEYLAVGSASGQAYILNIKAHKRWYMSHGSSVNSIQFSPNGDFVVSAGSDRKIKLTDTVSGVVRNTLVGHSSLVMQAVISPDGRKILSCSEDRTARLWDVKTGKTLRILGPLPQAIHNVSFSHDGRFAVASGYRSGKLRIWSLDEDPGVTQFKSSSELNSAVASSRNGLYIAAARRSGGFALWDIETGQELKTFASRDRIQSLQFTPDNRSIVAGGNRIIKVWDLLSGKCTRVWKVPNGGYIYSLHLSQDGRRCLSGNADGTVNVWDMINGKSIHTFKIEEMKFKRRRIAISPSGRQYIISIGPNIYVYDSQTLKRIQTLTTGASNGLHVTFSRDGEQIYALASKSQKNFQVFIFDWQTGHILNQSQCNGHDRRINAFAFSPNRDVVATVGNDLRLKVWQSRDGRELKSFPAHRSYINNIISIPGDTKFATVSRNESIRLWDFQHSARLEAKLAARFKKETVEALEKDPKSGASLKLRGMWLAFRDVYEFAIRDLEAAKKLGMKVSDLTLARLYWATKRWNKSDSYFKRILANKNWAAPHDELYIKLCLQVTHEGAEKLKTQFNAEGRDIGFILPHPNKKQLIVASGSPREAAVISVLDIKSRRVLRRFHGHTKVPRSLAVSEDGRWLLSGGSENKALLWHLETGQLAHTLNGHSRNLTFVGLDKKATRAVTISDDHKVRIWDLRSHTLKKTLKPHKFFIRAVGVSPDFKTLLTTDMRGGMKLIDLKTGEVVKSMAGVHRGFRTLEFSPDGRLLALAGRDSSLQIWSVESFELLYNLDCPGGIVNEIAFSDDSKQLLTLSSDKVARVFNLKSRKVTDEFGPFSTSIHHGRFLAEGKKVIIDDRDGTIWFRELTVKKENEKK